MQNLVGLSSPNLPFGGGVQGMRARISSLCVDHLGFIKVWIRVKSSRWRIRVSPETDTFRDAHAILGRSEPEQLQEPAVTKGNESNRLNSRRDNKEIFKIPTRMFVSARPFNRMGLVVSCCPNSAQASSSPFNREEVITVPDPKKNSVFVNTEAPRDATPLLKPGDVETVVEISDSDPDDFDPQLIERLMRENAGSDDALNK
jgi:hypothetical protein